MFTEASSVLVGNLSAILFGEVHLSLRDGRNGALPVDVSGSDPFTVCTHSFQTPAPEDPSFQTIFQRLPVTPCACDRTSVDQF